MKLTLICDQTQDAAAKRLFDRVLKNSSKEDIFVLTPENATLWAEEILAQKTEGGAISGITVTNVTRLCGSIYPSKKFASQKLTLMLLAHVIDSLDLQTYKKSKDKIGFASSVLQLIKLFSQSGLTPEKLKLTCKNKALEQKLADIKKIWETYNGSFPLDYEDALSKLKLLENCAKNGYFAGKTVYFAGFDDLSEGLMKVAEEICRTAKEVVASVVEYENSSLVNSFVCDEFLTIAKNLNIDTTWERKKSLTGRAAHISENLFAKNKEQKEAAGISVVSCFNRSNESEYVCSYINNCVLSGDRYKDIVIVVPNIDVYEKHLLVELSKMSIPYYSDSAKSIANEPLCRLVEEYLLVLANKSNQKDIISLCKNNLIVNNINDIWVYENFCKKYGIVFEDLGSTLSVGKNDTNYQIAKSVHESLRKIVKKMPSKNESVLSVVESIEQFFADNEIPEKIKKYGTRLQNAEQKAINDRIFDEVCAALAEIKIAFGEQTINYFELLNIWRNVVADIHLKLIPPALDAVRICDISTSKHPKAKRTIIMGACEGGFPSIIVDNGLLTDRELLNMNDELGLKVGPTVAHVNELEKLKVRELLSLGNDDYLITFPQRVGQEEQLESSAILSLRSICDSNNSKIVIQNSNSQDNLKLRLQFIDLAKSVSGAKKVVSVGRSRANSNKSFYSIAEVVGSAEAALKKIGELYDEENEQDAKLSKKLFFKNGKTSISELETYFSCPFLHFARYGLGVKDAEDASIKALDIGNFLHLCLEKITNLFIKSNYEITDEQFCVAMKNILAEIIKAEKYQSKVNALQLEALKNEACRLCYAVLKGFSNTGFKPTQAELRFCENGKLPAVKFENTNVVLEGKIDRVDKCGDYIRLVDYKTGQIDLGIDNLYYGKKIQLFAYLLSVIQDGKYKPAGVFYLPVRSAFKKNTNIIESYKLQGYFCGDDEIVYEMDQNLSLDNPKSMLIDVSLSKNKENISLGKKVIKPQSHILKNNELEKLAGYTKELANKAILQIENGEILASPLEMSGSMACDYCPFKSACKIDDKPEAIRHAKEKIDTNSFIGDN